jgi:hypothetical protein
MLSRRLCRHSSSRATPATKRAAARSRSQRRSISSSRRTTRPPRTRCPAPFTSSTPRHRRRRHRMRSQRRPPIRPRACRATPGRSRLGPTALARTIRPRPTRRSLPRAIPLAVLVTTPVAASRRRSPTMRRPRPRHHRPALPMARPITNPGRPLTLLRTTRVTIQVAACDGRSHVLCRLSVCLSSLARSPALKRVSRGWAFVFFVRPLPFTPLSSLRGRR